MIMPGIADLPGLLRRWRNLLQRTFHQVEFMPLEDEVEGPVENCNHEQAFQSIPASKDPQDHALRNVGGKRRPARLWPDCMSTRYHAIGQALLFSWDLNSEACAFGRCATMPGLGCNEAV